MSSILSIFSSVFSNQFSDQKLKTNLRILCGRIKLLREKRDARVKSIEQDAKKVLQSSSSSSKMTEEHVEVALKKCDSIARERNFLLILEEIREFASVALNTRGDLELTGTENKQLRTAVSSIFYAAGAFSAELVNDLPELKSIARELAKKFGKEFQLSCEREKTSEACGVSKQFMAIVAKKVRKEKKSDDDMEARAVLEKMAKEIGVELPRVAEKKKTKKKKKKKKSTRRRSRDSSSEASGGNSSSSESESGTSNKKSSSSRRKGNKTSNYATAQTAAKAARAAANKAQEAAEYAEALVATNELLATTTTTSSFAAAEKNTALDSNDDDFENEEGKEAEINAVIAAALDEARLEEETEEGNENENAAPTNEKPTLGGRGRGGPPPGIASSRETKAKSDPTTITAAADDALADRFEKLKSKR
jgi:hypothetical protein